MLRSSSKIVPVVLLSATALSFAAAGALLASCTQVVSAWAEPESLEFDPSEFDGTGAVTHSTRVCYSGPGQVAATATVPSPFSLVSSDAASGTGATTEQFFLGDGSCHDVVVSLAEPADLEERLEITVAGEFLNGTVVVALHASAAGSSGDGGGSDGGGADGGSTDGGGGDDGGGADGGGGTDDTGEVPSPCPAYSGLASSLVRTYETSDTYTSASGMSGTQSITVEDSDTANPVLVLSLSLTDRLGNRSETTERQHYSCDSTGSTLLLSEVTGTFIAYDGVTSPIARIDTYSDGMISMVPGFGTGGNVADIFQFERESDGPPQTINGSNVVTASGSGTTATAAGTFSTIQARINYAAGSEIQDYTAYLDADLGMVKSFYWDLVSLE